MTKGIPSRAILVLICMLAASCATRWVSAATQVPGAIDASHDVTATGAFSYTIPIKVPPGINGITPDLVLSYNSNYRQNGIFGVGWELEGLSRIERCRATPLLDGFSGRVAYDSNDRFCLDGQRLVAVSGTYGANGTEYRTEIDVFSKITSYGVKGSGPKYFVVQRKDGRTYYYGHAPMHAVTSQASVDEGAIENVAAPNPFASVRIWALSHVVDSFGNYIAISYFENFSPSPPPVHSTPIKYWPTKIEYGANSGAGLSPLNYVEFEYESRVDSSTEYMGGWTYPVAIDKRIKEIRTYAGGSLAREYSIGYEQDPFTDISRLVSVKECGASECYPESTFEWSDPNPSFISSSSGSSYALMSGYAWKGDFNGDGRMDIASRSGNSVFVKLSTGTGFTTQVWSSGPPAWGTSGFTWVGDFNGDGKADIATRSGNTIYRLTSTGSSFSLSSSTASSWGSEGYAWVGDFNGDGRSDIATYTGGTNLVVYRSNGSGFTSSGHIVNSGWGPPGFTWVGDFTGDGLADIVTRDGTNLRRYISTGTSFSQSYQTDTGPWGSSDMTWVGDFNGDGIFDIATSLGTTSVTVRFGIGAGFIYAYWGSGSSNWGAAGYSWTGDFNGDGLTDILSSSGPGNSPIMVRLSTGSSFRPVNASGSGSVWGAAEFSWAGDFNGDGRTDVATGSGSTMYQMLANGGDISSLMVSVADGLGESLNVDYLPITDGSVHVPDGSAPTYPEVAFLAAIPLVSKTYASNGIGGVLTNRYTYGGAKFHLQGRGYLGFAWRTLVEEDTPTGIVIRTSYRQDYPYIGFIDSSEVDLDGSQSVILESRTNTWGNRATGNIVFPYVQQSASVARDITGQLVSNITTSYLDDGSGDSHPYDGYGNPEIIRQETSDGHSTQTELTYAHVPGNWLISQLVSRDVISTLPDSTSKIRKTEFEYYPGTAHIKSQTVEPGTPSLSLTTEYQYDTFGNQQQVTISGTGMASRTSQASYGTNGLFPLITINPKGHSESRSYDPRTGAVTQLTDHNGLVTTWQHDSLGNRVSETRPDSVVTSWERGTGSVSSCGSTVAHSYYQKESSTAVAASVIYFDSKRREVQRCGKGFSGSTVYRDTQYDSLGRVSKASRRYFFGSQKYWAHYTYDGIGRVVQETRDGLSGGISYLYDGLLHTTIDRNGNATSRHLNQRGQVVKVVDELGGENEYRYEHFGNLSWVKDDAGNVSEMGYDVRGRKTWMDDPDMGFWEYQYNPVGDLIYQKDAKNQVVSMQYDTLGRMTQRSEPEGVSVWEYDSITNGVGKLKKVSRTADSYEAAYTYDSLSRISSVSISLGSSAYSTGVAYDSSGRISEVVYPTLFEVKNSYDPDTGQLIRVESDDLTIVYWEAEATDPDGAVSWESFGNGVAAFTTRDPATGLVEEIISGGSGNVQDLSYVYDPVGNLLSRADGLQSISESFEYDNLDRLTSSQVSGQSIKTYAYDSIGNITSKHGVGSYAYGQSGAGPHAVTSTSGALNSTYTYDANGNMLTGLARTISYTSFNKPAQITKGGVTFNYVYDPNYGRLRKTVGGTTTTYINSLFGIGPIFERDVGGSVVVNRHYIHGGSGIAAIWTESGGSGDLKYVHKDHLGSIDTITDASGNVVEKLSYGPFGERRQANWQDAVGTITSSITPHGFTGHEHLDDVQLIHMGGRGYDPVLGRFVSADPFVQYTTSTQGLNRYSYADNNPLSRTDRTGYGWLSKIWNAITGFFSSAWDHVQQGIKSAGRKIDKYKQEIAVVAAAIYTGGATLAATGSYVAAGASAGFVTGAYTGYQQRGVPGIFFNGSLGALTGGLAGNGVAAYGGSWTLGRVGEEALLGGFATKLQGGDFRLGLQTSAITSFARYSYNGVVQYDAEWGPGGEANVKAPNDMPVAGGNNIGGWTSNLEPESWWPPNEGGRISQVLNYVPGVNAVAGMHDVFQVRLEQWGGGVARNVLNVPGMVPAAALSYTALLNGPPAHYLSVNQSVGSQEQQFTEWSWQTVGK